MCRASERRRHRLTLAAVRRAAARFAVCAGLVLGAAAPCAAADRIVLRNLEILADQAVQSFDEDGVRLAGGRTLAWDEIEKGTVAAARQQEFDRLLGDLGEPLYRIRQRLAVGDYRSLSAPAEAVYGRYVGRRSPSAYMVFQATMWSRRASGRREAALAPYLDCLEYLRQHGPGEIVLPGDRRLKYDPATGITPELLPVWFDPAEAGAAMPGVLDAIRRMQPPPPPAARIYYGTLALAAGDEPRAVQVLSGIEDREGPLAELRDVAMAQREVASGKIGAAVSRLEQTVDRLSPAARPLGLWWLGMARIQSGDAQAKRQGVLDLLHLPAIYGVEHPELAGAGLYQAMKTLAELGDQRGANALRNELVVNYGQTSHAAKVTAPGEPNHGK
jgi:hypothetical protein